MKSANRIKLKTEKQRANIDLDLNIFKLLKLYLSNIFHQKVATYSAG